MPPSLKCRRQSSDSSVTSGTPLVSFKRKSLASQPQARPRQANMVSQPQSDRRASKIQVPLSQSHEQGVGEDDYDETLDHVIMAIDINERGTVGCAYYVAGQERLLCMEDIVHGDNDTLEKGQQHEY